MDYCQKCKKKVPTIKVGDKLECMICGTEIMSEQKQNFVNKITAKSSRDLQELTKIDPDTGKYVNAQKVGRNITIGLLIIITGILYSLGGFALVFMMSIATIILLVVAAVAIYILVKYEVV